jgi:hypothetical protein
MPQLPKRHILINGLGGLFYLFVLLQWLWAALPYLPGFISLATKLQPVAPHTPVAVQATSAQPPSLLMVIFASAVTIGVLAVTAYILIKLPATIGKTGEKITKNASAYLVPVVSRHAKLTPKKRRQLTSRVVVALKLILCILPMLVVGLSFNMTLSISYDATLVVGAFLAVIALLLLGAQLLFAKVLHVALKDTW